jgi:hypothetical protein
MWDLLPLCILSQNQELPAEALAENENEWGIKLRKT